jgi:enterobacterial common antigen flippase
MAGASIEPEAPGSQRKAAYRQILSSSALIGSSNVLTIAIGIVRTKVMAALLGPAGFGLMSAFNALVDLVRSIAAMGISNSGVRQIAASAAGGDVEQISRTVQVLRRTAIVLGVAGAVAMLALAPTLSVVTFGDAEQAMSVAVLALVVLFRVIADGNGALLQGLRKLADMARSQVFGALIGSVVAIVLVWRFGAAGVAPALVAMTAMTMLATLWYSRKVRLVPAPMSRVQMRGEVRGLLTLGIAFLCSGMLMMGAAYVVRLMLIRYEGLGSAGLFAAAWTLGGLYVGVVLQAMGADFYPRLVGLAADNRQTNQLVDDQTHVSLLLAGTGVMATLTLAPQILWLFYSAEFTEATLTLRWICLGMAVRVFTYPMGYVVVARNNQRLFIAVELAWTVINIGLTWVAVRSIGLAGAGVAFFVSYVFHGLLLYPILRRLTGYRWSARNLRLASFLVVSSSLVFALFHVVGPRLATALGCVATLGIALYSIGHLLDLAAPDRVPPGVQRVLRRFTAWRERGEQQP